MSLCVAEISLRCSSHAFAPLRNMMLNFHNNHNSQILFVQTHTCVYVQTCLCALRLIQARAFRNMLSHFQSPSLALPKAFRTSCVHFGHIASMRFHKHVVALCATQTSEGSPSACYHDHPAIMASLRRIQGTRPTGCQWRDKKGEGRQTRSGVDRLPVASQGSHVSE